MGLVGGRERNVQGGPGLQVHVGAAGEVCLTGPGGGRPDHGSLAGDGARFGFHHAEAVCGHRPVYPHGRRLQRRISVQRQHGEEGVDGGFRTGVGIDPPVRLYAVDRCSRGGVVGRGAAGVGSEEPTRSDRGKVQQARRISGPGCGHETLDPGVHAVGNLCFAGRRTPGVVRSARCEELGCELGGVLDCRFKQRWLVEHFGGGGDGGGGHAAPGVPERLRFVPRHDGAKRPLAGGTRGHCGHAFAKTVQCRGRQLIARNGAHIGGKSQHGLGRGVGAAGDEPCRHLHAVRGVIGAVLCKGLFVERA
ncbi:hypothetical protein D9M72_457660 [compost metagenome]